MIIDRTPWDEMVLEVLEAARNRVDKRDFDIQCRLTPVTNGKSYFDRIKVFERLILDHVIEIDDGILRIAKNDIPEWLVEGLKEGSDSSWEIFDSINPANKIREKIDRLLLEEIGLQGELEVINQLKNSLPTEFHHRIKHISLEDDSAGYDIQSPSLLDNSNTFFLEVKTTSRPSLDFNFFISRNEARVGSLNENWLLIGVIKSPIGFEILGSLSFNQFLDYLPVNNNSNGRWETARITIPRSSFSPNLP